MLLEQLKNKYCLKKITNTERTYNLRVTQTSLIMLQLTSTDKLNKREDVKFAWLRESALYAFSHLWLRKGRQRACAPVCWHNDHHLRLPPRSATRYRSWTRTRADWLISIWLRQFSPILRFFFLRRTDFPAKNLCRRVLLIMSLWRESLGNHS